MSPTVIKALIAAVLALLLGGASGFVGGSYVATCGKCPCSQCKCDCKCDGCCCGDLCLPKKAAPKVEEKK